ncbi:MAG: pilus motility taxis protein HmpF, partial [Synechococcales bacterium]|nr:pilus motility taxis protein HmpF [Synechococcales bacterium]
QQISELLQQMERCIVSAEGFQENTQQASELLVQHQAIVSGHWQNLEQQRSQVDQLQGEVDQQSQDLARQWQEWREQQRALEQAKSELKLQQSTLQMKEEYARLLGIQIQRYGEVHQTLYSMAEGLESVNVASHIDLEALEKMPIDALQALTHELQSDLEKSSQFVRGQEEELDFKQQELDALAAKLAQVNEFDRMTLEAELTDERDAYQFLEDTLVGQRRNLKEKEGLLKQHGSILAKRQGKPDPYAQEGGMNLGPVFSQLDGFRHQQSEELQRVEAQIAQTRNTIDQSKSMVNQQTQELDNRRKDLDQQEHNLQTRRLHLGELRGRVALYQEMLQPLQDNLSGLQQRLEGMTGQVSQLQQSGSEQRQALAQVQEILVGLAQQPQFVA